MARTIQAAVTAILTASQRRPVLLFELGTTPFRYARHASDITFATNLYTALNIEITEAEYSTEGTINRITVKFDNLSGAMKTLFETNQMINAPLRVIRIYKESYATATYFVEYFEGFIERINEVSRWWVEVSAISGSSLQEKILSWYYIKKCQWAFGGPQCNRDGYADLTTLTYSGEASFGATTYLKRLELYGLYDDSTFKHGTVQVTVNGILYQRKISDYYNLLSHAYVVFDVPLPVAVQPGDNFQIWKGCNKLYSTCVCIDFPYGPTADNTNNFGGFLLIPKKRATYATY
jgi:hypothetical protein